MWKYKNSDELYHSAWQYNNPDELYHHGILGMRWRHRKAQINQNKKLKKYRKAKNQAEYNARFNNTIKTGGRRGIKVGATVKTLGGLAEIGYGLGRQQFYNKFLRTSNKPVNMLNTGVNSLFVARGIQNVIGGHRDRKALKNYDIKQMNKKYKKKKSK